jgi:hypothetical protein
MEATLCVPECLMALDRPDDEFETGDAWPEQHLRLPPGGDVPVARAGPVEPRTREEYYEALRNPGKTEFPATWGDGKVITNVLDVARKPDKPPTHQDWNDTWLCTGTRDNVEVSAVVERSGDILTGWPEEGGPGVVRNLKKGSHDRN